MRIRFTICALLCAVAVVGCKSDDSGSANLSDSYSMGSVTLNGSTESSAVLATRSDEVTNEVLTESTDANGVAVALLPERLDIVRDDIVLDIEGTYIIPDEEAGVQLAGGETAELIFEPMTLAEFESEERHFYAADYTVSMSYGDPTLEALDNPCYVGSAEFKIVARKEIETNVTMTLCNSIVYKVVTTDKFNSYYDLSSSEFHITTTAGATREYEVTKDEETGISESDSALFFVEAGTTLTLSGKATKTNGVEIEFDGALGVSEAGKCYTITIDAEDVGSTSILVQFDDSIEDFDVTEVQSADLRPGIVE